MLTSIHLSYILGHLPLEERFVVAKRLGFNAVEFPFPFDIAAENYAELLKDNGLKQISIGTPTSNYRAGEPGYSVTPSMRPEFDRAVDTVIEYAKVIGCRNIHLFSGCRAPDVSRELALETYQSNLTDAYDRVTAEGLNLVIEPVNSTDFQGYLIDRLDVAMEVIAQAERPGTRIILDLYHAHVNNENPLTFLRDHTSLVEHIQLADYPGRHEPGTEQIDFEEFFQTLKEVGYSGSLGLEYVPTRSVLEGVPLADRLGIKGYRYYV